MNPPVAVRPYREAVAVMPTTEVLSPCGLEVPRFDLTNSFEKAVEVMGGAVYPRSRRCPECMKLLPAEKLLKMAGSPQLLITR